MAATAKAEIRDSQAGAIATLTTTNATLVATNATLTAEVKKLTADKYCAPQGASQSTIRARQI